MIKLIKGLYISLDDRLDKMLKHLETIDGISGPAGVFSAYTVQSLYSLKERVKGIMDEGLIGWDEFAHNSLVQYSLINEEFLEIESFRYVPLSRYRRSAEGYFEWVIQKIYNEFGSDQPVPFISTTSNSDAYYWAYPKYNMIVLPHDEEKYLLCLPDLYHEIGHLIFHQYGKFLVGDCLSAIRENYTKHTPTIGAGLMHEAVDRWESSWLEEFSCDMMATYLVGPAYAWEHLKVSATQRGDNNSTKLKLNVHHPPNEARMRAIFKMLELTGYSQTLDIIKKPWEEYLAIAHKIKPTFYPIILSDELINLLAKNVLNGCKNIRLISYEEQLMKSTLPVSKIINDAWDYMRRYPEGFSKWEKGQIELL